MKKMLAVFLTALALAILGMPCTNKPSAEAIVLPWNKEHADALRVFQFLNYIDFGLSEAIQTEDSLVLARQYDVLAGNLDLAIVKDEQVIRIIEALGELVDRTETDRLDEQVRKIFSEKTRERIYEGISSSKSLEESIRRNVPLLGAPWYDYRRNRDEYSRQLRGKIALTDGQLRKLTELRKEMLRISWELFEKYEVGKEERLMEKEMDRFVSIIDEDDPSLMARQLKRLIKDQPAFEAFPPFWFYSGMAEMGTMAKDRSYGLNCFNRYYQTYRDLFKKDPLLAMSAVERLALLSMEERVQRLRNLELLKENCSSSDWQFYLFASILEGEMGMIPQAKEDLFRNIDNDRQVSLCSDVMGTILLNGRDERSFSEVMAQFIEDERILPGDILRLASYCDLRPCRKWLDNEMKKMALSMAKSDESCVRIEIPSGWIKYPCSMDIDVKWSQEEPGWATSLSATATAILPEGKRNRDNRLVETPSLQGAPTLPKELHVRIVHGLYDVSSDWELVPPDAGFGRDVRTTISKAFPFYRPEVGRYELTAYEIGNRSIRLKELPPSEEEAQEPSEVVSHTSGDIASDDDGIDVSSDSGSYER